MSPPSSMVGVAKKKKATITFVTFFYGGVAKNKKTTITFVTFFDGFAAKKGDNNIYHLFGGFVTKKVISYRRLLSFFFFFLLWSFWSSSFGLIINNEMVVCFNVEGCNG
jgi:hypothetical protein